MSNKINFNIIIKLRINFCLRFVVGYFFCFYFVHVLDRLGLTGNSTISHQKSASNQKVLLQYYIIIVILRESREREQLQQRQMWYRKKRNKNIKNTNKTCSLILSLFIFFCVVYIYICVANWQSTIGPYTRIYSTWATQKRIYARARSRSKSSRQIEVPF